MAALAQLNAWIAELEAKGIKPSSLESPSNTPPPPARALLDAWIDELGCTATPAAAPSGSRPDKKAIMAPEKKNKNETSKGSRQKSDNSKNSVDAGNIHAGLLELRVGKILEAWPHPESDKLWCEKIDVGEPEPRLIASGLRAFYKQGEMEGARVIVLCNLKAKKMAGFASVGMVMCASNQAHDHVKMILPPESAPVGSLVTFDGLSSEPASSAQVVKKKIAEACFPDLRVGPGGVCCYKDIPFQVESHGIVTASVGPGYSVS